jgi:hypothetical protein
MGDGDDDDTQPRPPAGQPPQEVTVKLDDATRSEIITLAERLMATMDENTTALRQRQQGPGAAQVVVDTAGMDAVNASLGTRIEGLVKTMSGTVKDAVEFFEK